MRSRLFCYLACGSQFLGGVHGFCKASHVPVVGTLQQSDHSLQVTASRSSETDTRTAWEEVAIDQELQLSVGLSEGERIKQGESVILLRDIVEEDERKFLIDTCVQFASSSKRSSLEKAGLVRLPTIEAFERALATQTPCANSLPGDVDQRLKVILQRVMRIIDDDIQSLSETLFGTDSLTDLFECGSLHYSSREPAINVYTSGGEFLAHKDAQTLTVLLPLSCPKSDFSGGGTAFWSQDARGHRVEDPSLVMKPSSGTAILFGGCVTHAGRPVMDGTRVVFVASFSRKGKKPDILEHRDIYGDAA